MAQSVKVNDKLPQFKRSLYSVLDNALKDTASDVLIEAKNKAPFKKGGLRSNSDFKSIGKLKQRVSFWIEYARFQEFGGDGRRTVRNYTTAGTGKGYLKNAGDKHQKKIVLTFKKHAVRARA